MPRSPKPWKSGPLGLGLFHYLLEVCCLPLADLGLRHSRIAWSTKTYMSKLSVGLRRTTLTTRASMRYRLLSCWAAADMRSMNSSVFGNATRILPCMSRGWDHSNSSSKSIRKQSFGRS